MKRVRRKTDLSPARQRLIDLMRKVDFGTIEDLEVVDGEPVVNRELTVVRDILIGKPASSRAAREIADFELRHQVLDLFEKFDRDRNLRIERLIVQGGLPHLLKVKNTVTV